MLVRLLVSWFGTAVVFRILSLLEKTEVVTSEKFRILFIMLHLPLYLHLFFKELSAFTLIYIGIFLITLILFPQIIAHFRQKTFENLHFEVVERLFLMMKAGNSAQISVKTVFRDMSCWEKVTFAPIFSVFEIKTGSEMQISGTEALFFGELREILMSSAAVAEQLKSFREGLRVNARLRRKSKQALAPAKAQAAVCVLIYIVILFLSWSYLGFSCYSRAFGLSFALMATGVFGLLRLGKSYRWKT